MVKAMLITLLAGYLLGNINGSVLISRLVARDDVRRHGSGNAGFTNFFRNYGRKSAMMVMVLDAAKTAAACLIGKSLFAPLGLPTAGAAWGALAVSLGHDFPVFLGFRGGKGVVCGFVSALMVDWHLGLVLLAVFAVCYLPKRMVSLASVVSAIVFALSFAAVYHSQPLVCLPCVAMGLLAVWMHRTNIRRLLAGEEKPTDFFEKGSKKK